MFTPGSPEDWQRLLLLDEASMLHPRVAAFASLCLTQVYTSVWQLTMYETPQCPALVNTIEKVFNCVSGACMRMIRCKCA